MTMLSGLKITFFVIPATLLPLGCTPHTSKSVGPSSEQRTSVNKATTHLIVALDRSDSTIPRRSDMLTNLDDLTGDADTARAILDIWAYDTTAVRVWGPNPSEGTKKIQGIKEQHFRPNPNHPRRGTYPGKLLTSLAEDHTLQKLAKETRLVIVLLTDGGADHASDAEMLRKAAKKLQGDHSSLTLLVIGIDAEERQLWDHVVGEEIKNYKAVTWSEGDTEIKRLNLGGAA